MKKTLRLATASMLFAFLGACATTGSGPGDTDTIDSGGAVTNPVVISDPSLENIDPNSIAGRAPATRIIYFDFDTSEVRSEYLAAIAEHGRFLATNTDGRVTLEGHTDERGTREYNVALGESRARAVARMLQLQGVDPAQLKTISYGEELPADEGHNESAWDLNRRVIIVYETE